MFGDLEKVGMDMILLWLHGLSSHSFCSFVLHMAISVVW